VWALKKLLIFVSDKFYLLKGYEMCGVVGGVAGQNLTLSPGKILAMANHILHRGPDSHGVWQKDGAFLGHRRLAIVDLSAAGHQPMLSHDGRLVISYNGEIYNHLDIRAQLETSGTINWRGHSDTETLVEALARWGIDKTLATINGMFAFACWDMRARKLTLARDPFGEKPLLYALKGDSIVFASELSAIRTLPEFNLAPDPAAISSYLQNWYVPVPLSIIKGVQKLPPGNYMVWQADRAPILRTYWSVSEAATRGRANLVSNESDALDELEALLLDSVKIRMMSDVPLGALLSGGVDSSLVVALMQKSQSAPVRTFTIGFDDPNLNEAPHAAAVAAHLGTQHEMLMLSEEEAIKAVPRMGAIFDEPFADASQVPTYLVSALARQHVTVALTGDGCDELFSGYARHVMARKAWNMISRIPGRKWLGPHVANIPQPFLNATSKFLKFMVPVGVNPDSLGRKLRQSGRLLEMNTIEELYKSYMTSWPHPEELMMEPVTAGTSWEPALPAFETVEDKFVWLDSVGYLHNDILTKVDRASMACSLETRIPPLDRRVAEFAWRLPQEMRWRNGKGKWVLREILYRHVPQELVDRPKRGFSVPLDNWLRGPLRTWSNDLLSPARLKRQGLLRPDIVAKKLSDFENGRNVGASQIWTLLMLQSWLEASGR
jgi:asparagine synthase (glutamine-hydrolysing)